MTWLAPIFTLRALLLAPGTSVYPAPGAEQQLRLGDLCAPGHQSSAHWISKACALDTRTWIWGVRGAAESKRATWSA
jgi:hypothetical protein